MHMIKDCPYKGTFKGNDRDGYCFDCIPNRKISLKGKKVLYLTLHRHWFDEIKWGRKIFEYREKKLYWRTRLVARVYDYICFRNGYGRSRPYMVMAWSGIDSDEHRFMGKSVYAIKLSQILEIGDK